MKVNEIIYALDLEAARFKDKAKEIAHAALHKSTDGKSINDLEARLIRDHEIRSETYRSAARIAEKCLAPNRKGKQ